MDESRRLEKIFRERPFKVRNADEYELVNVLNLFISPVSGLTDPYDYENMIIKGRMGSGKTMYLRANQAYRLYSLVPSFLDRDEDIVLPVFLRLSDFQHLSDPKSIYNAVIIKIVEELLSIYLYFEDGKSLAKIHEGFRVMCEEPKIAAKLSRTMQSLAKLGSLEYVDRISGELGLIGKVKPKFFELSASWRSTEFTELKGRRDPGIGDIQACYENLLGGQNGHILLLIDEAGSLGKDFFIEENGQSFFEILMNQFRTSSFIRTKIAVYPNSFSDVLTETRYGDTVNLDEDIKDTRVYGRFRKKTIKLIDNYINSTVDDSARTLPEEVFDINSNGHYGDSLEQIIYASNGNMRRLILLLDQAMSSSYEVDGRAALITKDLTFDSLKEHAQKTEMLYSHQEREFLNGLVNVCRHRSSYKFTFPSKSPSLYKFASRSQEYNVINVEELGVGSKGTVYSFDYAYAVLKGVPTHREIDSEKVQSERSLDNGRWISRVSRVSDELLEQAALPGKIDGRVAYIVRDLGFIDGDDKVQYFFRKEDIIVPDRRRELRPGKSVRFFPHSFEGLYMAAMIEIP